MSDSPPAAFSCPYADAGEDRCPDWRCDCFIDSHPDDPFGLHPEAFIVVATDPCGDTLDSDDFRDPGAV